MHKKLEPVNRENFSITFGKKSNAQEVNPEIFFAETIKFISKTAVGEYFWFIANTANGITHAAGGMLEKITPIKLENFVGFSPEILFNQVHPDDLGKIFAFTNHWISIFQSVSPERREYLKPTIYIRLRSSNETYNWVMIQYIDNLYDEEGNVSFGLTLVTNINHLKKDNEALMSLLDTYDNSCQLFYCSSAQTINALEAEIPKISQRELEVVKLLAAGFSSKQIAGELNLSIKTVDNHRQNILHKTNTKSTGELVAFCINNGFV